MKKLLFIFFVAIIFCACEEPEGEYLKPDANLKGKMVKNKHAHGLDQDRYVVLKNYGDLKVHYRIIGKGPIDMVFIPGWTNPLTVYTKQFDYFRDKAKCIYIDLPGTGLSDAPEGIEYTQALMVDAMYRVVKKEGLKKFIGIGFSWSGTALKLFEMKYPGMINQLILLDMTTITWPPMNEATRNGEFAFWSTRTYEDKMNLLPLFINPDTAPDDLWEFGLEWPNFPSWLMANMRYHWQAEENCQPYPWEIPILVIYNSMNELKENITNLHYPGCEIHLLGGDQHVIQWAYYEEVNQLMDDFIADRPGKKY